MASAAIPFESTVLPGATAPAWWRRGHTYAMPAVAVSDVVLAWFVTRLAEKHFQSGLISELASSVLIGFLFAKCFLLGLWAALGSPSTVPRWLIVGGLGLAGSAAVAVQVVSPNWEDSLTTLLEIMLFSWITIGAFAVLLLPLRRLAGWRIDFDAAYHPSTGQRRGQMSLMDYAGMTCAVALVLSLCRCLMALDETGDAWENLFPLLILAALLLVTAAPAAYATLARRRPALWLLVAAAWLVLVCWCQSLLAAYFPDLYVFGGPSTAFGMDLPTLAFHVGGALAAIVPLALLRPFGLKLLTVT